MPDTNDLLGQMAESLSGLEDALEEVQDVMKYLPDQISQLDDLMSAFSNLAGEAPAELQDLGEALSGFGEMQEEVLEELTGEPDWEMEIRIKVPPVLEIQLNAVFDLQKILQTYESTKKPEMDGAIEDVLKNIPALDPGGGMQEKIMEQLKQGRGAALVQDINVLRCKFRRGAIRCCQKAPPFP